MDEECLGFGLANTHCATTTTSGLGVLSTDTEIVGMTETTVESNLFHPLQILSQFVIQVVGQELRVFAILNVLLTIEKVFGNVVLKRVLHDGDNAFQLFASEFTSTLA